MRSAGSIPGDLALSKARRLEHHRFSAYERRAAPIGWTDCYVKMSLPFVAQRALRWAMSRGGHVRSPSVSLRL